MADDARVRLNKYVADSGLCSRREADRLIDAGRVAINGRRASLGEGVSPGDRVAVDGRDISPVREKIYIALHKPVGVVCTADPREPMNVVDYVGHPERLFPIGRLDKDSSGLLLMTNDGGIVNRLLRAEGGHEKEYEVVVDRPLTGEFLRRMAAGVPILDTVTLPCRIQATGPRAFRLVLTQGLNRQIRRMCEALHYNVVSLKRVRVMNVALGHLKPGRWRNLGKDELNQLLREL